MAKIHIFLITGLLLSVFTHMIRGFDADRNDPFFADRTKRSLEGQPCASPSNEGNGTACILAYTTCNPETLKCECDKNVSVGIKMTSFPELVQCIPFDYVKTTGHCVPTSPDICGVLVAGAFCDASKKRSKKGQLSCTCQIGGEYPNCTIKIGTVCKDDATCTKDIPNSYCANINTTDGLGKCACGQFSDGRQYAPDAKGTTCLPVNCAAKPCRGQASASTCVDLKDAYGYKCNCNNNTKGRSHSLQADGICCPANQIPCLDLKKCLFIEELCDGKSDCEDCSDEKQFFCTGALPTDNPQCRAVAKPSAITINYPSNAELAALLDATRNTRPTTNFATAPMTPVTYAEADQLDPSYKSVPFLTQAAVQRLMEPNW